MPRIDVWSQSVPRVELDQRSREERVQLERIERPAMLRASATYSRLWRLVCLLTGERCHGASQECRVREPLSDRRPSHVPTILRRRFYLSCCCVPRNMNGQTAGLSKLRMGGPRIMSRSAHACIFALCFGLFGGLAPALAQEVLRPQDIPKQEDRRCDGPWERDRDEGGRERVCSERRHGCDRDCDHEGQYRDEGCDRRETAHERGCGERARDSGVEKGSNAMVQRPPGERRR